MKNISLLMLMPALVLANEATTEKVEQVIDSTKQQIQSMTEPTKTTEATEQAAATTTDTTNESNMTEKTTDGATAFLLENAKKEGVVSLNENLQYKVLEEGEGSKPNMHSSVTVHYEGSLLDGTEFDSSFKRNEPATFNLDQVIQGWTEVLPHMKTGSTWMVYIGPELAYGARGIPGTIPPNSVLVFKIQLLKVNS